MKLAFRTKLLVLMTLVVTGIMGVTLYLTQQHVEAAYLRLFEAQFRSQISYFTKEQKRLQQTVADACQSTLSRDTFLAALREHRVQEVFDQVVADVSQALDPLVGSKSAASTEEARENPSRRPFIALTNGRGEIIATNRARAQRAVSRTPGIGDKLRWFQDKSVAEVLQKQAVGYLTVRTPEGEEQAREGLFTPVILPDRGVVAALFVGYPLPDLSERLLQDFTRQTDQGTALSGVWLEQQIYSSTIPQSVHPTLNALLARAAGEEDALGPQLITVNGEPYRLFQSVLNPDSPLPQAKQICLYSLTFAQQEQTSLKWKVVTFGVAAVAGAALLIFMLSQHLTKPLRALLRGTESVRAGDYSVRLPVVSRDEVGDVTKSFNEMAEGLAVKEKYRTILDLVADKDVAETMLAGSIELGGEMREVSVLFCDVRAFTAWSRTLPANEVLHWLNMHMTALTRIVYEHGGIVDKFIGDAVMAVFGAPKSDPAHARNAAACALKMLEERARLNATSGCHLDIGIGIASGEVLAGNLGAESRLNYTVTGDCVNLASRLADQAARMEALVDEATAVSIGDAISTETAGDFSIKGYATPVTVCRLRSK